VSGSGAESGRKVERRYEYGRAWTKKEKVLFAHKVESDNEDGGNAFSSVSVSTPSLSLPLPFPVSVFASVSKCVVWKRKVKTSSGL
jgi:hypothetical protein